MSNRARYLKQFYRQLNFISRSCAHYDTGQEDEAIRLATTLRLLFHDTSSSTSLLKHLNFKQKHIFSSAITDTGWKNFLAERIDLTSSQPVAMKPRFNCEFIEIPITKWWSEDEVFEHNGNKHTRKQIILCAANHDGGAHVDSKLKSYYKFLCSGEWAIGITGNLEYDGPPPFPQGQAIYPCNGHLALIRQFTHEFIQTLSLEDWSNSLDSPN
ncbi:MAG: hypothetical protein COA78_10950 [Blastopirellula sp.]|nr:MAG: hypothetical protein COA78_10950 [Blastopirellula sp.]